MSFSENILYVIETSHFRGKTEDRIRTLAHQLPGLPEAADLTVVRTEKGKPYFLHLADSLYVSVTHCGDYWLCLFSPRQVGIDLQIHTGKNHPERIARRFFHPEETEFLSGRENDVFFSLWTAKESYVKYTGKGIAGQLDKFSVIENGEIKKEIEGIPLRFLEEFPQYTCCVCGGAEGPIRIIRIQDPV